MTSCVDWSEMGGYEAWRCPENSSKIAQPWLDRAWLLACLLLATFWCVSAATRLSVTFDEPNYISNGLEVWRSGSPKLLMRQGTMPLPVHVTTLPLYLWERWRGTPFRIGSDTHSNPILLEDLPLLLPLARLGTLPFLWLLIGYGWLLGKKLAGPWGGRLAACLIATEPSILAHSSLATTDVAVSATLVALVYHFYRGRDQNWGRRVGLPALWYGLAILSKASALVFAPLCLVAVELSRLAPRSRRLRPDSRDAAAGLSGTRASQWQWQWLDRARLPRAELRPFWRDLWQIGLLALVITFVYVGSDWQVEPTFVKWADTLGDSGWGRTMQWVASHLRIFTNAGEGLMQQIKHNVRGHGVYLLGHVYPRAVWYYFPVALSVKLTLPMLLTPLLLLAIYPKALKNVAVLGALGLLAFSVTYRVQIGIRLILPVVALLAVGLAAALADAIRALGGWRRQTLALTIGLSLLWTAITSITVWPHGLCYTNELWGGTAKGYLRLSDSNYDWGQGLKDLDQWRQQQGLPGLDVWHYSLDPARERPPFHSVPLQQVAVESLEDIGALLESGYLAVGTTLLYGSPISASQQRATALLRSLQPIGRTMTHLIYAIPKPTSK